MADNDGVRSGEFAGGDSGHAGSKALLASKSYPEEPYRAPADLTVRPAAKEYP
jgi:hypothetical protein